MLLKIGYILGGSEEGLVRASICFSQINNFWEFFGGETPYYITETNELIIPGGIKEKLSDSQRAGQVVVVGFPLRFMTLLVLSSWLGFEYQTWFPCCWVGCKFSLLSRYACHDRTVRAIMQSLLWFIGAIAG